MPIWRNGMPAEAALRLARFFGTDAQGWMNLQDEDESAVAKHEAAAAIRARCSSKSSCPCSASASTGWRPTIGGTAATVGG